MIVAVLGGTSSRFGGGEFHDNGAPQGPGCCHHGLRRERGHQPPGTAGRSAGPPDPAESHRKAGGDRPRPGRPYAMEAVAAHSDAVFCCFYPGPHRRRSSGPASLWRGRPGRPPAGVPAGTCGAAAVYYNYKDSYRGMDYYDARERPRYSFGSGRPIPPSPTAFWRPQWTQKRRMWKRYLYA